MPGSEAADGVLDSRWMIVGVVRHSVHSLKEALNVTGKPRVNRSMKPNVFWKPACEQMMIDVRLDNKVQGR